MNMLFVGIGIVLAITGIYWKTRRSKAEKLALQHKLSVVESKYVDVVGTVLELDKRISELDAKCKKLEKRKAEDKLTQDQIDYRDKVKEQYQILFEQVTNLAKKQAESSKEDFEKLLKEEFEKACAAIKFNEIEYKKTITKKRAEFNRKNSKNAKPQRRWRYINEE
jgi:hypothetical protein